MAAVAPMETIDVALLKDEAGGLMAELGISTITFYKGDFKTASGELRTQIDLVVAENPWIVGRLVRNKEGIVLRHPVHSDDLKEGINDLFNELPQDSKVFNINPNTPYTKLCRDLYTCGDLIVPDGYTLMTSKKPVTLLSLIAISEDAFALVFSMSHAIGDGRTYYEIFKMLQPRAAVRKLQWDRVHTFPESMRNIYGRKELEWADSTSTALLFTFAMMCNGSAQCFAFHVDEEKVAVAKQKAAAEGDVKYVSTNDILTSTFFNVTKARIGMMGIDCRDRELPDITRDLVGNYVTAVVLDAGVFGSPASLRKMYTPGEPYVTTKGPLPSFPNCCGGNGRFAMATNWSSFSKSLVIPEGCTLEVHLPLQHPDYCVYDLMIPFSPTPGKTAVLIWTVSADEDQLKHAMPLGERVAPELFPNSN